MSQRSDINPLDPQAWTEAPSEFAQGTGDLAGYWESASPATAKRGEVYGSPPVTFTPLHVTLTDSDIDPEKTSTLIHCRLLEPCILRSSIKDEGFITFPAGTLFGIWAKPGMKDLKKLAGAKVWMRNGQKDPRGKGVVYFKDINKPGQTNLSPMVLYTIKWPEGTKFEPLRVQDDYREESLDDAAKQRAQRRATRIAEKAEALENSDDFIPF